MRVLQVIRSAYRCNLEEQDDPAVWIARALKGAKADLALLLRGNATNYAVEGQDASRCAIAGRVASHPPSLERDLAALMASGASVYVIGEDAQERGIDPQSFVPGTKVVGRAELAALFREFDGVWHW
jgi:hypothetical protein